MQEINAALEKEAAALAEEEERVTERVRRKEGELLRARKRLESLATARPAFQEESDRLERELAAGESVNRRRSDYYERTSLSRSTRSYASRRNGSHFRSSFPVPHIPQSTRRTSCATETTSICSTRLTRRGEKREKLQLRRSAPFAGCRCQFARTQSGSCAGMPSNRRGHSPQRLRRDR